MNVFSGAGRGDFFGIIIPGSFLVANIVLLWVSGGDVRQFESKLPNDLKNASVVLLPLAAVASYAVGLALRFISPGWVERFTRNGKFPYYDKFKDDLDDSPKSYKLFFDKLEEKEFEACTR